MYGWMGGGREADFILRCGGDGSWKDLGRGEVAGCLF